MIVIDPLANQFANHAYKSGMRSGRVCSFHVQTQLRAPLSRLRIEIEKNLHVV